MAPFPYVLLTNAIVRLTAALPTLVAESRVGVLVAPFVQVHTSSGTPDASLEFPGPAGQSAPTHGNEQRAGAWEPPLVARLAAAKS
jgi:hypothetical protein